LHQRGESDLCFIKGVFYLFSACDVEEPTPKDIGDVIGVDLGIVKLAVDSDGEKFSGEQVEIKRRIYAHRRRNLQRKGTKAAKHKLEKLSRKQARYQKDVNHSISKHLVKKAQDTGRGIALENLKGIRDRVTVVRRKQRARHSNWSFYQLRSFIEYKSQRAGVKVFMVDPKNTSRECPKCGHTEKGNRKSQSIFSCNQCSYSANADYVAALNIRARAVVNLPMVATASSG
jgi:IS605 OrfB family transposase